MLREMPSTRAVARIESPCSCAWRMAFQSVCWRGVGGRSGLTRACGAVPVDGRPVRGGRELQPAGRGHTRAEAQGDALERRVARQLGAALAQHA